MDHYSIVESPSPRQRENGTQPEPGAEPAQPVPEFTASQPAAVELVFSEAEESLTADLQSEPGQTTPAVIEVPSEPAADLDASLQAIVQKAQYISNASGAAIALRQGGEVVCRAASGSTAPDRGARLEIKSGLTAECLRGGEIMRCDNALLDPRVDLESCKRLGIESIIIMPIRRAGKVEGVLELFSAHAYSFQERDVEMLKGLAEEIGRRLAEAEQPASLAKEEASVPPPAIEGLIRCDSCGATIAKDAVFCTECGSFQENKLPRRRVGLLPSAWKARLGGRRLVVPAVFVAMALAVAVVPAPHTATAPAGTPQQTAAMASAAATPLTPVPNSTQPDKPKSSNDSSLPTATNNPSIANSVKQLLGGVSSDFSKLLPVNEKAEPASNGDPNLTVWVDTRKGFYYCPGDGQYGHTEKGAFMTQKQAESNYYIPALAKPCI